MHTNSRIGRNIARHWQRAPSSTDVPHSWVSLFESCGLSLSYDYVKQVHLCYHYFDPNAEAEARLRDGGLFTTWIFLCDDAIDDAVGLSEADASAFIGRIRALLRGERDPSRDAYEKLTSALRRRFHALAPTEQIFRRFVRDNIAWLDTVVEYSAIAARDVTLSRRDFVRDVNIGVFPTLRAMEIIHEVHLSDYLDRHFYVQMIRALCARHVARANDLFSFDRDRESGLAGINTLSMLANEREAVESPAKEAVLAELAEIETQLGELFDLLVGSTGSAPDGKDAKLRWIELVTNIIGGNVLWSVESGRYN